MNRAAGGGGAGAAAAGKKRPAANENRYEGIGRVSANRYVRGDAAVAEESVLGGPPSVGTASAAGSSGTSPSAAPLETAIHPSGTVSERRHLPFRFG